MARMPNRSILAAVAGRMPWNFGTSSPSRKPGPISGVMTNWPFGLRWLEASFARNWLWKTPADAVSAVHSRMAARIFRAIREAIGVQCAAPGRRVGTQVAYEVTSFVPPIPGQALRVDRMRSISANIGNTLLGYRPL
jgi:hypothetical protein